MSLNIEKVRLSTLAKVPAWVWLEHKARYRFAANFVSNKIIVDCACGSGEGTEVFFKSGAKEIKAFDLSEDAIREAKAKCNHANVDFKINSATKLPLSDEFAEVYVSLETIEHLDDDKLFLMEANRVLKPGGIFICSTPNRTVTNPGTSLTSKPSNQFHVREYSSAEFGSLLKEYFGQVEFYGQNPNKKFKVDSLNRLGFFLPFHIPTRVHQAYKLLSYFLNKDKASFEVKKISDQFYYEYITAVCIKS
ncbi:MAG: class I SAM-dependent methyltransferase [Nitrospirota bacterium]